MLDELELLLEKYWDAPEGLVERYESCCIKEKKIKTIGTYYHWIAKGGAQRVVVQLIWLWKKMGYEVVLFTDEKPSVDDYELPNGVQRVVLQSWTVTNKFNYKTRGAQLEKVICDLKIDVMVYHEWSLPLLPWDMLVCKQNQVPFIIYCHSIFSNLLKDKNVLYQTGKIFSKADTIITLNEMDTKYWEIYNTNVIQALNPTYLMWENINTQKFYNKKILWMGRLVDEKCPIDVLEIAKELTKYDSEIEIYMLGDSVRPEYTQKIYNRCKELQIENNIKIQPFCKDVVPYLEMCSVYLMTSQSESFSLTLQETQCYGMPCVMYELPYLALVQDKKGIIEVQQGAVLQAAREIIALASDAEKYKQMNEGARENFLQLYAENSMEKCWEKIFFGLVDDEKSTENHDASMKIMLDELHDKYQTLIQKCEDKKDFSKKIYSNMLTKEIAIFGTGRRCQRILRGYPDICVKFYLDNNRQQIGEKIDGKEIKHPDEIANWDRLFIIISVIDYERIQKQLEEKGLKYREDFVLQQDILEI